MPTATVAFASWVDSKGVRYQEVAAALKISHAHLNNIKAGRRKPGRALACAIEAAGGPPARGWDL